MKSELVVLLAVLSLASLHAQQAPPPKPATAKRTPSVSASELEARKHYRIGLVAIQNNDLPTAEDELANAVELSPKNVLMLYNLAMVDSKRC